jgi:hypothetical protein
MVIRRLLAVTVFISALASGVLAVHLGIPFLDERPLANFRDAAWIPAALLAYCFGTLLVPFRLFDLNEPYLRTLKIWGLMLLANYAICIGLLAASPQFGWSNAGCLNASLVIMLLGPDRIFLLFQKGCKHDGNGLCQRNFNP